MDALPPATLPVPHGLLVEADRDPGLTGFVQPADSSILRLPIVCDELVVGFLTPRQDLDGRWRTGAIYVTPLYRGRGLATQAIREFMGDRRGAAFIEWNNDASRRVFEAAGFREATREPAHGGSWFTNCPDESGPVRAPAS